MDSISNHYAAKRAVKANVPLPLAAKQVEPDTDDDVVLSKPGFFRKIINSAKKIGSPATVKVKPVPLIFELEVKPAKTPATDKSMQPPSVKAAHSLTNKGIGGIEMGSTLFPRLRGISQIQRQHQVPSTQAVAYIDYFMQGKCSAQFETEI